MKILPKGKGPISNAIRELDRRTVALTVRGGPGVRVESTSRGTVIDLKQPPLTAQQLAAQRPRWG